MTYEEAKIQIQAIPEKIWDQLSEPDREAMEMAFSALQEQEAKAQLSAEGTTSDLIRRQAAIDVCDNAIDLWHGQLGEGIVIAVKKKIEELPPAQPESEERKAESVQNVPKEDLISRKAAIDALDCINGTEEVLRSLPSAQPETYKEKLKEIADALSEKFAYMNSCLNERDIILGYLGVKRTSKIHCNTDCTNIKCESYRYNKRLPSAQPEPCEDAVSREAAIDVAENAFVRGLLASPDIRRLPSVEPEIIRCKDCKHHWTHRCMDSMPTEICDLDQTFYDANVDFCSLAERRTDDQSK